VLKLLALRPWLLVFLYFSAVLSCFQNAHDSLSATCAPLVLLAALDFAAVAENSLLVFHDFDGRSGDCSRHDYCFGFLNRSAHFSALIHFDCFQAALVCDFHDAILVLVEHGWVFCRDVKCVVVVDTLVSLEVYGPVDDDVPYNHIDSFYLDFDNYSGKPCALGVCDTQNTYNRADA